jgi:DNA-binding CsgD family transcriptional regulator
MEFSEHNSLFKLLEPQTSLDNLDSSILNDLDAFVFIVDVEQLKPVWLNNYFSKRMGYTEEDFRNLSSQGFLETFHPKSLVYFKQRIANIDDESRRGEHSVYQIRTKSNAWIYLMVSSRVYRRKENGNVKLLLGFATEIEKSELNRHARRIKEYDGKLTESSLIAKLSKREKAVIRLITLGMTDKEMAENLSISIHTTKTHRKRIISKLGLKNTAALVKFAVENGLD